jgi:hypothetical protein
MNFVVVVIHMPKPLRFEAKTNGRSSKSRHMSDRRIFALHVSRKFITLRLLSERKLISTGINILPPWPFVAALPC